MNSVTPLCKGVRASGGWIGGSTTKAHVTPRSNMLASACKQHCSHLSACVERSHPRLTFAPSMMACLTTRSRSALPMSVKASCGHAPHMRAETKGHGAGISIPRSKRQHEFSSKRDKPWETTALPIHSYLQLLHQ